MKKSPKPAPTPTSPPEATEDLRALTYEGVTYSCPFSRMFRRHTPGEVMLLTESITKSGIIESVKVYRDTTLELDNCILDGEGRLSTYLSITPTPSYAVPFEHIGEMTTNEAFELAKVYNDHRRQDDPEAVTKRIARVILARRLGESIRAIAEKEGVSKSQVERDAKHASELSGVPHGTPEHTSTTAPDGTGGKSGDDSGEYSLLSAPPGPIETDLEKILEAESESDADAEAQNLGEEYRSLRGRVDGSSSSPPATPSTSATVTGRDGKTYPAIQPKKKGKGKTRDTSEPKPLEHPRDQLGRVIPENIRDVFERRETVKAIAWKIGSNLRDLATLDKDREVGSFLRRRPFLQSDLATVRDYLRVRVAPYCVCPACASEQAGRQPCPTCGGRGWLTRAQFDLLPQVMKEEAQHYGKGDAWECDDPLPPTTESPERICLAPGVDAAGEPIPKHLRDMFEPDFLLNAIHDLERLADQLKKEKHVWKWMKPELHVALTQAINCLGDSVPHEVCRHCQGAVTGCAECCFSGYHPHWSVINDKNVKKTPRAGKGKKGGAA